MVVVGHRGLGGIRGLLLGWVGMRVSAHAHCPVVVVRGDQQPDGPVVVGIDAREPSDFALSQAFEQATLCGVGVRAVYAYPLSAAYFTDFPSDPPTAAAEEAATTALARATTLWEQKYPQVTVTRKVLCDTPAAAVIAASKDARMLVLGARSRNTVADMALGSTGHAAVLHAECPVMVVHTEA